MSDQPSSVAPGRPGAEVFPDFEAGAWQLYILATTSNFPDIMMRAYASNRLTFLFFGSFLVVCLWFLLNVVLAVLARGAASTQIWTRSLAGRCAG